MKHGGQGGRLLKSGVEPPLDSLVVAGRPGLVKRSAVQVDSGVSRESRDTFGNGRQQLDSGLFPSWVDDRHRWPP
jgi:hypothetical protein